MINKQTYESAIEKFINYATQIDELFSIYLGGSVARGDFIPSQSDIDIYVVLRSRKTKKAISRLEEIRERIEKKYFPSSNKFKEEMISTEITTRNEIIKGKSFLGRGFEYNSFMRTGKLLWGEDIRKYIPKPSRNLEKRLALKTLKEISKKMRDYNIDILSSVKEAKKILLEYNGKWNKTKFASLAIDGILRSATIALYFKGKYPLGKKEVVKEFCKTFDEKKFHPTVKKAYNLWENWSYNEASDEEVFELLCECVSFCENIYTDLTKTNSFS